MAQVASAVPSRFDDIIAGLSAHNLFCQSLIRLKESSYEVFCYWDEVYLASQNKIFEARNDIVNAGNVPDIKVDFLLKIVAEAVKNFQSVRNKVRVLETDIHRNIELCREKKIDNNNNIRQKDAEVQQCKGKISELESEIADKEQMIRELDNEADWCERQQRQHKEDAETKGVVSVASFAVGAMFAPFTGGVSLLAGAAVGVPTGASAISSANQADEKRSEARRKRGEIENKRGDIRRNQDIISSKESDVKSLKEEIKILEQAGDRFDEMLSFLYGFITALDCAINNFQQFQEALVTARTQTDSFKIVQALCERRKDVPEKVTNKYLDALREKWTCLEKSLMDCAFKQITM